MITAAQCGKHNEKRLTYGDSVVIGPRGEILGQLNRVEDVAAEKEGKNGTKEPQLLTVEFDLGRVEKPRLEFPLVRRTYGYPEI